MESGEVRLYTDECVHAELAPALRTQGYNALNPHDVEGMLGASDSVVWDFFIREDRILFTQNIGDFATRHHEWVTAGREHPGIIFSHHYGADIGSLIRSMTRFLGAKDRGVLRSNVGWL